LSSGNSLLYIYIYIYIYIYNFASFFECGHFYSYPAHLFVILLQIAGRIGVHI
jgi:hypothetical protein